MSVISTATIRSTNAKESKDKRNRERLLAGPVGSEFSLTGQDVDLEMDYYDYNVVNAGAAPGSYLGMDPAFLVWIPPLDESGEILQDLDQNYHEMEDIRPKQKVDPGSNTESPEEELLLPKTAINTADNKLVYASAVGLNKSNKNLRIQDCNRRFNEYSEHDNEMVPLVSKENAIAIVSVQLHEFPRLRGSVNGAKKVQPDIEKETQVEKLSSEDSNKLEDIKFVDDDEEDVEMRTEAQCNIEVSYQDSNILSSS